MSETTKEIKIEIPNPYLIGYGNHLVGSPEYIKKLNTDFHMEGLLSDLSSVDYYNAVKGKNAAIKKAFHEILLDLEKYIDSIHLIAYQKRAALAAFLNSLADFLNWTESSLATQDYKKCLSILKLTDKRTGYKAKSATQIDRRNAVNKLYRGMTGVNLSLNDRLALVTKAQKEGLKAAGTNRTKQMFLNNLAGRYGKEFFSDVLAGYMDQYKYNYKGKNNYEIGTENYIKHYEKMVFGGKISKKVLEKRTYRDNVKMYLKKIAETMEADSKRQTEKVIILQDNINRMVDAQLSLNKLSIYISIKAYVIDEWVFEIVHRRKKAFDECVEIVGISVVSTLIGSLSAAFVAGALSCILAYVRGENPTLTYMIETHIYVNTKKINHFKYINYYYDIEGKLLNKEEKYF